MLSPILVKKKKMKSSIVMCGNRLFLAVLLLALFSGSTNAQNCTSAQECVNINGQSFLACEVWTCPGNTTCTIDNSTCNSQPEDCGNFDTAEVIQMMTCEATRVSPVTFQLTAGSVIPFPGNMGIFVDFNQNRSLFDPRGPQGNCANRVDLDATTPWVDIFDSTYANFTWEQTNTSEVTVSAGTLPEELYSRNFTLLELRDTCLQNDGSNLLTITDSPDAYSYAGSLYIAAARRFNETEGDGSYVLFQTRCDFNFNVFKNGYATLTKITVNPEFDVQWYQNVCNDTSDNLSVRIATCVDESLILTLFEIESAPVSSLFSVDSVNGTGTCDSPLTTNGKCCQVWQLNHLNTTNYPNILETLELAWQVNTISPSELIPGAIVRADLDIEIEDPCVISVEVNDTLEVDIQMYKDEDFTELYGGPPEVFLDCDVAYLNISIVGLPSSMVDGFFELNVLSIDMCWSTDPNGVIVPLDVSDFNSTACNSPDVDKVERIYDELSGWNGGDDRWNVSELTTTTTSEARFCWTNHPVNTDNSTEQMFLVCFEILDIDYEGLKKKRSAANAAPVLERNYFAMSASSICKPGEKFHPGLMKCLDASSHAFDARFSHDNMITNSKIKAKKENAKHPSRFGDHNAHMKGPQHVNPVQHIMKENVDLIMTPKKMETDYSETSVKDKITNHMKNNIPGRSTRRPGQH